jgi:hypothetical protein
MPVSLPVTPLRYQPSFEQPDGDEAATTHELIEALRDIQETTFRNSGRALRGVHAKSHGLLQGELEVLDGLPPELAQGLYARPGRHPVVLRFSTNAGDILDDSISLPRGLALKVLNVEGERLPDAPGSTQDYVLVNAPAFAVAKPKQFLGSLKLLARTTDTPQAWKKLASKVFRGAEALVEAVGGESAALKTMGGHPQTHPLGETFYSQVPLLHGPYMAKISVTPVSSNLKALKDAPLDTRDQPDALRRAIGGFFRSEDAEWDLRVQLCTDLDSMPIEDASIPWPEEQSPFVTVARLRVPRQTGWSEARAAAVDDGYAFSPWHGLAAHRPLGGVMRVRKATYEASSRFRAGRGRCPIHEPRGELNLPA